MKPLLLTGFMGVGKSLVAKILSQSMGLRLVDLDREIENAAGMTIPEIFETQGEERFREMETECLRRTIAPGGVVIATGGGILTRPVNFEVMADAVVVNLDAPIETLLNRVRGSEGRRPLLKGGEGRVRELFEARRPLYEAVRLQVETEGKTASEVAEIVAKVYRAETGGGDAQD